MKTGERTAKTAVLSPVFFDLIFQNPILQQVRDGQGLHLVLHIGPPERAWNETVQEGWDMRLTERRPRETGRDYALRTIRDNIIHLELAPGGMVSENELAAEMGLSRTPVREALIELSKARIVEIYPQKGSAVSLIDVSLVEESRFMRKVLECAVVELACEKIDGEGLRRLQENVRLQNFYLENYFSETLMELDNQFHKTLFEIAEKPQVYALMDNMSIHFDRVRNMALSSVKNVKIVQDHEAITDAIAAGDAVKARALTEEHLGRYKIDVGELRAQYPDYFK